MVRFTDIAVITPDDRSARYEADNNNGVVNFFNYSHNYTREELNMV